MNALRFWFLFSLIFSLVLWKFSIPNLKEKTVTIGKLTVPLFFILAFVLRVVLSTQYTGYLVDVACFSSWSDRMVSIGPAGFYAKGYFSDYPPLYLYVLYVIGLIKKLFHIVSYSEVHVFLLKSPAILADLGIGYVIYKIGTKHLGLVHGICLSALYLFQPVVLMNSCLWGQIDSVFTLFVIMTCIFLERQSFLPAVLFFGFGLLLKPQMLIFTPVMILGAIRYVFRGSFSMRMLSRALAYTLLTLILVILVATPFGMENVINQYVDTIGSYPYASVNAYNFWAGLGFNWRPQTSVFFGMPCSTWGFIVIVLAASLSIVLGLRLGNLYGKYFVVATFLIVTVFTYSVRMHERYLFPMFPLILLGFTGFASRQTYAASAQPQDHKSSKLSASLQYGYPIAAVLLTCLSFANTGHVLFFYDPSNYDPNASIFRFVGFGFTVASLFFYYVLIRLQTKAELTMERERTDIRVAASPIKIQREKVKMTKLDYLILLFIMVLYSAFALRDLGDLSVPQTVYQVATGQAINLKFPEGRNAASFYYYTAPSHNQQYLLGLKDASEDETAIELLTLEQVFSWKEKKISSPTNELSLTANSNDCAIIELVFIDEKGNHLLPENASEYPELFDEQELFPKKISFRNSMYFDEIYHGRTAYEFLHGLRSYENTHPPLGKILISIGVSIFGMSPFGWRIVGTIIGIAMLPILYLFAKKLMGDTPAAALTCFIFAFDFMHFVQTRLATIDVYIVFFILCMYYFLYVFLCEDFTTAPMKKLLIPLCLCGISMGLGVASKWTGVYAGLGLGILFFGHLFLLYRRTKALPVKAKQKAHNSKVMAFLASPLGKRTKTVILFCLIFFVAIPMVIYVLSYLPFRDNVNDGLIKRMLVNQKTMFDYHSNLNATHYFSSPFYEWPFMVKPIWYYSGVLSATLREGITSFGNPLVWWAGIPAVFYMIYLTLRKHDKRALFLLVGYFAQYLPWFFVTRITFIYHYFPCVIFVVLMLGYSYRNLKDFLPRKGYLAVAFVYMLSVFGLFILFYPVLSGQPVEYDFVMKYLKWFKEWYFVSKKVV